MKLREANDSFVTVYHYDAFTTIPGKGNPAGIVLDADYISDTRMQEIAKEIGFNETAFILKSDNCDWQIRYFTPGCETNLCGHATVGGIYCLYEQGLIAPGDMIQIETKAGVLPIRLERRDGKVLVHMAQAAPEFVPFDGDVQLLASSLGISQDDIDESMPIVYGSTGSWTLLVPIKQLSVFEGMHAQNKTFPIVLKQMPRSSVHPFCFAVLEPGMDIHSRHFSSPYSGTEEDSVTGTASGVIGCYYAAYVKPGQGQYDLKMEQGYEMDRPGEVLVHVEEQEQGLAVTIAGTAVFVGKITVKETQEDDGEQ